MHHFSLWVSAHGYPHCLLPFFSLPFPTFTLPIHYDGEAASYVERCEILQRCLWWSVKPKMKSNLMHLRVSGEYIISLGEASWGWNMSPSHLAFTPVLSLLPPRRRFTSMLVIFNINLIKWYDHVVCEAVFRSRANRTHRYRLADSAAPLVKDLPVCCESHAVVVASCWKTALPSPLQSS